MPKPQPDLQVKFQNVVEETISGNLAYIVKRYAEEGTPLSAQSADEVLRCALMGGTAAIVSYWFAKAHKEGMLGEAREALDATIEQFWGQMLMGLVVDGGDNLSLPSQPN